MSTFWAILGAVLPPLVGGALAAFSLALLVLSLRGIHDAINGAPPAVRELRKLRAEVRAIAERIELRERELWTSMAMYGAGSVALELDVYATDLLIAIGDYPRPKARRGGHPATNNQPT